SDSVKEKKRIWVSVTYLKEEKGEMKIRKESEVNRLQAVVVTMEEGDAKGGDRKNERNEWRQRGGLLVLMVV
ncbi:hypothetical protein J1N35_022598, partial [Gossypium stocksii]